ncbi:STAS domain-containing protein [Notoacmeibacter sp. MSK16QG-6]|uniref:STAS domain-containing protein n=1 Tax=Notoacmeibacter sp. MSK16QG-6 TaxID=2957982 RepID=UPI0020A0692C|nr:STAS domain-containing protein [Notoacmeibacter sp. MSK16QG-6]MCP1200899.1 STAS domain-containing protein [Notoacmeibacter sp. MSK16QG-6]
MQDDMQAFTPLTVEEPETPVAPAEFTEVLPLDDSARLTLDDAAPSLEMEELPAFEAMDDSASLDDLAAPVSGDEEELPLPDLDALPETSEDTMGSTGQSADPFADLAIDGGSDDDGDDPFADLAEPVSASPDVQVQIEGAETPGRLALPEILDLDQAENLRATLQERIGTNLTIDAAAVSRIDTPCLEVAIAASKQWLDDGFSLDWENPSEPFTASLDRIGLSIDFLRIEGAN